MEKELSTKNTKQEILDAYNEILEKVQSSDKIEPKVQKEQEEKKNLVKSALQNSEQSIIKNIAELKIGLNTSLDKISEHLVNEQKRLSQIQEAIGLEQKRLEDLYQINANADSLAALIMTQKEKKVSFEKEIADKKELTEKEVADKISQTEQKIQQLNFDFDVEIAEKKALWKKEQNDHELSVKERDTNITKIRKREEEEYAYNIQITRKKDKDNYEQNKELLEKQLIDKKTNFDKEIAEREKLVAERETEFAELKKNAENFEKELAKAITETEKRVTQQLTTKFGYETQLKDKETEGEIKLKDQTILTLQNKIKDLETLNKQLSAKVDNSEINVKEIAIKALDTSSNIRGFEKEKQVNQERT
jgi:hypothetical protein